MIQTKPKSKRGRKSKPDWQRLRNEIKLHLDDCNYAVVKDMAREAGLSLNKFIGKMYYFAIGNNIILCCNVAT